MAFYNWFLTRQEKQQAPIIAPIKFNPIKDYADELIAEYSQLTDYIVAEELYQTAFEQEHGIGMEMQYFSERKSRIK